MWSKSQNIRNSRPTYVIYRQVLILHFLNIFFFITKMSNNIRTLRDQDKFVSNTPFTALP